MLLAVTVVTMTVSVVPGEPGKLPPWGEDEAGDEEGREFSQEWSNYDLRLEKGQKPGVKDR